MPPGWQSWPMFRRVSARSCSRYHRHNPADDHDDQDHDCKDDRDDLDDDDDDEVTNVQESECTIMLQVSPSKS